MKTFNELSEAQQNKATEYFYTKIILNSVELGMVPEALNMLQYLLEEACDEAEATQTPWFAAEIFQDKIENNYEYKNKVLQEAARLAKMSFYREAGDVVVELPPG